MAVSWINSFNFFSDYTLSIVKYNTLSSLIISEKELQLLFLSL